MLLFVLANRPSVVPNISFFFMLQGVVEFYTFCGKMHFKVTCVQLLLHFVVAYNETDPEVPQGDEKTSIEDHGIALQAAFSHKKTYTHRRLFQAF